MSYLDLFSMPNPVTISGRTSSITNSFVNGIIPCIQPSEEEVRDALSTLGMDEEHFCCAYCGDPCTEWDHLNPLVINKQPTGYCSEIHNLVPSCGKCNQSKGNKHWRDWMLGTASKSPRTRGVVDLDERVTRLESYCEAFEPLWIDLASIVGKEKWSEHWSNHAEIVTMMRKSQVISDEIRAIILDALPEFEGGKKQEISLVHQNTLAKPTVTTPHSQSEKTLKVGEVARLILGPYLQSSQCPRVDIDSLVNPTYSREVFGMNFPILVECTEGDKDEKRFVNGHPRYYADALVINDRLYLLTKEWKTGHRRRLIDWLLTRGVNVDTSKE